MMEDSKIFSNKSMSLTIKNGLRPTDCGTSIDLSMIWLLMLSNLMEVSYGLAKTMMEMSNLISLLKVMDLLVS
jgi:hypothetical protein